MRKSFNFLGSLFPHLGRGHDHVLFLGFPGGSAGGESACDVGDLGSIPGLGRSPGEGHGNPLQYSGLESSMDRAAWWLESTGLQSPTCPSGRAHIHIHTHTHAHTHTFYLYLYPYRVAVTSGCTNRNLSAEMLVIKVQCLPQHHFVFRWSSTDSEL